MGLNQNPSNVTAIRFRDVEDHIDQLHPLELTQSQRQVLHDLWDKAFQLGWDLKGQSEQEVKEKRQVIGRSGKSYE